LFGGYHIAGLELAQQLVEFAPVSASAAHLLAKDALAAGGLEPVELGLKRLADSRDAGISVQLSEAQRTTST